MESPRIQRVLVSVSDKQGLADFARGLVAAGVEIFSTGGTRKHLESEGIPVRDVSDYTGFPEMMHGRLKTLHPKVHGGILCRHDNPEDMQALAEHGILTFELVVVNLYPFETTIRKPGVTLEEAIEQIDIGGPTMVRAAAKNHAFTTIATDQRQYGEILQQIRANGRTTLELRRKLAGEAFAHTALYDRAIADYFAGVTAEGRFPGTLHLGFQRQQVLRYGENPHQEGAVYAAAQSDGASVVTARQLNGKELSYNNLLDLDSALAMVRDFSDPAAVVIKHNNPCGAAEADTLAEALKLAMAGDPLSAFGSVLGLNRTVDAATAQVLTEPGLFVEAIIAPEFEPEALDDSDHGAQVEGQRAPDGRRTDRQAGGPLGLSRLGRRPALAGCRRAARPGERVEGRDRLPAGAGPVGRPAFRLGDGAAREVQRHRAGQGPHVVGRGRRADEPRRFGGDFRQEGGRSRGRVGDGLRRLLPLPRFDRGRRRGGRGRRDSARRLAQRRRRDRRLQPPRRCR